MAFPYSQVHVHDGIVFAARSGRIESFNVHDGNHLSTWIHPDTEKFIESIKPVNQEAPEDTPTSEPPAKRQKTSESDEGAASNSRKDEQTPDEAQAGGSGKKGPKQPKPKREDRPVIIQITSTSDGKHIVAVSGHDKAIWVFENTGAGQLKELSKRVMPKRPNVVTIGPGSQILSADKFGDVYALPLIPDESSALGPAVTRRTAAKPFTKPAANEFTVHSRKNLVSLRFQQKHAEQVAQQKRESGDAEKEDVPEFELSLLLGHVSMVTSMVLGENKGRTVILTGDRDEHVRVSRYIPQAHVIEGFCLGHKEFVTSLAIPQARGELLVSGGGDDELFVWNWQTGKLLSKSSVLSLVQELSPEATKVAVSQLLSFEYTSKSESGASTYVLAICEGVKAIFSWQLTETDELKFPSIIQVPGNPLNLTLAQSGADPPALVVALDTTKGAEELKAESLNVYGLTTDDGKLAVEAVKPIPAGATKSGDADILDASAEEIKRTLYGIGSLRKVRVDYEAEAEDGQLEGPETEADVGEGARENE